MGRRRFAVMLGTALVAARGGPAAAQTTAAPVVGLIANIPALRQAFVDGMRDAGYVDGQNVRVEQRAIGGAADVSRFTAVVDELRHLGAVAIVAASPAALAAAHRRPEIPVVGIDMESDPIAAGFAKTLARPGGHITGLFLDIPELGGKQIQLLTEALGRLSSLGIIWDDRVGRPQFQATTAAATAAGLAVMSLPIQRAEDLDRMFTTAARKPVQGVVVLTAPVILQNRAHLVDLALRHKLPTISIFTLIAEAGGLIGYGPDFVLIFRRAASYVDRILKGAKPADLPIERPSKFELVVNLKTARALGLAISPALLARAERVIE
jgi:putative ABC transport system substrate-binding protein